MKKSPTQNIVLVCLLSLAPISAEEPQKQDNLFDILSEQAEAEYLQLDMSTASKKTIEQQLAQLSQEAEPQEESNATLTLMNLLQSRVSPILGSHPQFSDEWWKKLLTCKGCTKHSEVISCPKLLKDNPQWQEVDDMSPATKKIIMKKVLVHFYEQYRSYYEEKDQDDKEKVSNNHKVACNVACALCVGANPDERLDGFEPHTALHAVSMRTHYGLFHLLVEKGADVNLECIPAHPLTFAIPEEWKDELRAKGSKQKDDLSMHNISYSYKTINNYTNSKGP